MDLPSVLPSVQPAKGEIWSTARLLPAALRSWDPHWLCWDVILIWLYSCAPRAVGFALAGGQARISLLMCPLVRISQEGSAVHHVTAVLYQGETGWECMDALGCVHQFSPL